MRYRFVRADHLNTPHLTVYNDETRFKVLGAGRRYGKTYLAIFRLMISAMQDKEKGKYFYVAPTYRMAREICWDAIKKEIPDSAIAKINESRLDIILKNGAIISLRGSDNPDSLRGVGLSGAVLDEAADMKPETWTHVIRPALSDRGGWCIIQGTPKGRNWFYEIFNEAKVLDDWAAYQFTTIDGGYVPEAEVEAAKHDLDERTFKQEYLASFQSYEGLVAAYYDRQKNASDEEIQPGETLHIGTDMNVGIMPACVGVKRGDTIHILDEFFGSLDTPSLIEAIESRYPDHPIRIYPDASGRARKSVGASETDIKLMREAGFTVMAKSQNPMIMDRVNSFNSMCMSSAGDVRFYVKLSCKHLIQSLERHIFDDNGMPDKKSGFDHMYDAVSYLVYWHSPLTKTKTTTVRRK